MFLGKKELTIQGDIVFRDGVRRASVSFSKGKGIITNVTLDDDVGNDGVSLRGSGEGTGQDIVGKDPDVILENGLLFPGFVDLHVHAREDSSQEWTYKENYITAAKAALAGGVTAFADMPNTPAAVVEDGGYDKKLRLTRYSGMDVVPYAGIGPGTRPLEVNVPYKVFMAKSIGELCFSGEQELRETLEFYRGHQVSFHCEDPEVLTEHEAEEQHRDRRPPDAEIRGVATALELIDEFELSGTLCHISTRGAIDRIRRAKRKDGSRVTVEAAPHHLLLEDNGEGIEFPACLPVTKEDSTADHLDRPESRSVPDSWFQVNPPIRGHDDRTAVFEAFSQGEIDFLATDHAPHTIAEKQKGMSGIPHLDSYGRWVGCLLEMGVDAHIIALTASYNPGDFITRFGYPGRELEDGGSAHFTHLEPRGEMVFRGHGFSKSGWDPLEGRISPWSVGFTILKGRGWKRVMAEENGKW